MKRLSLQPRRSALLAALAFTVLPFVAAAAADRTVEGVVTFKGGEPASGAAVQLEDRTTLEVLSHSTDKDGHFRFTGLNPDKDYDLRATKNGHWSKSRTVSRFSSRPVEFITLSLSGSIHD